MNKWPSILNDIAWKNDYIGFERECEFDWNYLPKDMRHYILGILFKDEKDEKSYKLISKEFYQLYHIHNTNIPSLLVHMKRSIYNGNLLYLILFDQIRNIELDKLQEKENRIKSKYIILFEFVRWCKVNQLTINPNYINLKCRSPPNEGEIEHIYQFFLNNKSLLRLDNLTNYKNKLINFFLTYKPDIKWIKTLDFNVQDVLEVCNFVSDKIFLNLRLNGRVKYIPKIYQMVQEEIIIFTPKSLIESLCNVKWLRYPLNSAGSNYDQRDEMKKLLDLFCPFELLSTIFEITHNDNFINNKFILRAIIYNCTEENSSSEKLNLFLEKWGKYSVPHSPHNILINKQLIYSNVLINKVLEYKDKLNKTYLTYLMYKNVIPIEPEIISKSAHFQSYFNQKSSKPLRFYFETLKPQDLIDFYVKRKDKCCDAKFYMLIEYLSQFPEYKELSKKLISESIKSYRNYRHIFILKILNFEVEDPQDFAKIFTENTYSVLFNIKELVPTMNLELLYHISLLEFDFGSVVRENEVFGKNLLARLDLLGLAIANNNEKIIDFYFRNYKSNQSVIINYINSHFEKRM